MAAPNGGTQNWRSAVDDLCSAEERRLRARHRALTTELAQVERDLEDLNKTKQAAGVRTDVGQEPS